MLSDIKPGLVYERDAGVKDMWLVLEAYVTDDYVHIKELGLVGSDAGRVFEEITFSSASALIGYSVVVEGT